MPWGKNGTSLQGGGHGQNWTGITQSSALIFFDANKVLVYISIQDCDGPLMDRSAYRENWSHGHRDRIEFKMELNWSHGHRDRNFPRTIDSKCQNVKPHRIKSHKSQVI